VLEGGAKKVYKLLTIKSNATNASSNIPQVLAFRQDRRLMEFCQLRKLRDIHEDLLLLPSLISGRSVTFTSDSSSVCSCLRRSKSLIGALYHACWESGVAGIARSRIVTVVPWPGTLLIEIAPPWASMSSFAIARPRPLPPTTCGERLRAGSAR
jgi:hypothetical protein